MWRNCEINIPDFSFNKRNINLTLTNRGVHQMQSKYLLEQTKFYNNNNGVNIIYKISDIFMAY